MEQENKNMFAGRESETQFISEQKKNNPNKNIAGIVILIIILAAGGYFVYKNKFAGKIGQEKQEIKNVVTPQIIKTSPDNLQKELPQGFPKSIPLNGKTKVIESYSATYPNVTAKQSTISFQSSKTPQENYDFYLKWTKDNKWKTINQINDETAKSLYLRKENKDLNIIINDKISITYVEV